MSDIIASKTEKNKRINRNVEQSDDHTKIFTFQPLMQKHSEQWPHSHGVENADCNSGKKF